jgi:hypothetical protein
MSGGCCVDEWWKEDRVGRKVEHSLVLISQPEKANEWKGPGWMIGRTLE